jgi:hypothetical protein
MEPLPDYGDHMTLQEFIDACKSGCFIDYDGHGYYATATEMSDVLAQPSAIVHGQIRTDFTHVMWFNK